jgi:hypothetical protein
MKTYMLAAPGAAPTQENTRPTFVPESLWELHGPTDGVVKLPVYLDWSADSNYNLSSPVELRSMYETVLSEATGEHDLFEHIDRNTLLALWPELVLPRRVRAAWEGAFPELASC